MKELGKVGVAVFTAVALGVLGCDSDTSAPPDDSARITDLSVDVIDGYIMADLMPIVPPDPMACHLALRITNTNSVHTLDGLSIPSATVYLSKNGEELGVIRFETEWDGSIAASGVDTVTVDKITENQEIFAPPCLEYVYLVVEIMKTPLEVKRITTPSYLFSCPVMETGATPRWQPWG